MNSFPRFHHPFVSIIMATYNRASFLSRGIESVLRQTFQDWELIIVDDGSVDETFEVINPYLMKEPKIRYLKQSNRRQSFAQNSGLQASFGEHITFLDSDDYYKANHLQSRIELIEKNKKIDLITGGFETEADFDVVDYFDQSKMINIRECVLGPTFFGKRAVFMGLEGFQDIIYGNDTDFWMRAEKKFQTLRIDHPRTYVYSRAEDSIAKNYKPLSRSTDSLSDK